jgi:hypothetical protein
MTAYQIAANILRTQGVAVFFMLYVLATTSGLLPYKLCESVTSRDQIIAAMEKDRKDADAAAARDRAQYNDNATRDRGQIVDALQKIGSAMEATVKATARMDSRDAIKTCASIADKEARVSCIQVAVTGK